MNPGVIFSAIGLVSFLVIFIATAVGYTKVCDNEYLYQNQDRLKEVKRDKSLLMLSSFTLVVMNLFIILNSL